MLHLLVVNGWSANAGFWDGFEQGLDQVIDLQVIDLDEARSLEAHLALIDQYIKPNTLLLGWSLGGALAIQYASSHQYPSLLGLITVQTNPCFIAQENWPCGIDQAIFQSLYELVSKGEMFTLHRQFSHLLVTGSDLHKLDRAYLKGVYQTPSLVSQEALLSGLVLLKELDVRECLKNITTPCLHIYGAKDALVSATVAPEVQKINPKNQCEVIADMAHLSTGVYRSQVQQSINHFLKDALCKVNG